MQIFIEAIDLNIWKVIEVGPYVPTMVAGNTTIEKPREEWSEEERRLVQYNLSVSIFGHVIAAIDHPCAASLIRICLLIFLQF